MPFVNVDNATYKRSETEEVRKCNWQLNRVSTASMPRRILGPARCAKSASWAKVNSRGQNENRNFILEQMVLGAAQGDF